MPHRKHSEIGRLLPVDVAGGVLLPCLPASELALLAALDTGEAAPLATTLAIDPALTLWALVLARGTDEPPRTLAACAAWLASPVGVERCQAALAAADGRRLSVSRKIVKRWRRLARQSVNTAALATTIADMQPVRDDQVSAGRLKQRVYLLGLVHNAAAWLSSEAIPSTEAALSVRRFAAWLPAWLVDAADRLQAGVDQLQSAETDPVVAAVSAALRGDEVDEEAFKAARRAASHAARAWRPWNLQGNLALSRLLPKLAATPTPAIEAAEPSSEPAVAVAPTRADASKWPGVLSPELEREKLEALAEFAAGAGHEINNPLAVISGRAQLMMQSEISPERRRDAALIHAQAQRVHEMIADLMFFARPPQPQPEVFDLGPAIEQLLAELAMHPGAEGVALRAEPPAQPVQVKADRSQLLAAVRAMCLNSLFALAGRGELRLRWARQGGEVMIAVADTGPGIRPEVRRHLFDPYYSGRESGRGLGVGLSKAWRIVTMHGGTIDVDSSPGQGTTMTIHLPVGEEKQ